MTIGRLLFKFGIAYGLLLIAGGFLLSYFGAKGNNGLNAAILIGCLMWVCGDFAKKNGRYFSSAEKRTVVLGMLGVDFLLQLVFGSTALRTAGIDFGVLLISVLFVTVLHGVLVYFCVGFMKKSLIKQGVIDGQADGEKIP